MERGAPRTERVPLAGDGPNPTAVATEYSYVPFGSGSFTESPADDWTVPPDIDCPGQVGREPRLGEHNDEFGGWREELNEDSRLEVHPQP